MKKIIKFGLLLAFTATLFSCEDFLETRSDSSLTEDVLFQKSTYVDGLVMGMYDILGENRSYRKHLTVYLGVNTDI